MGNNVTVQPGNATITFSQVTGAGTTTIAPMDPNSTGTLPGGYAISGTSLAYQLTTTASVSPPIDVCFNLPTINDEGVFNNLRILHGEGGQLFDRTTTHSFASRSLCARTTSLSPFLITAATMNAIEGADYFVNQHYRDFLNREPDAGGLGFWSNQITECQQPGATCSAEVRRINVSAAFFLSIEFQETGYLVERIYKVAYGNATGTSTFGGTHQLVVPIVRLSEFLPDTQEIGRGVVVGQTGWEQVLENNKQAFMTGFVQRTRFTTAYPGTMTAAQFVDTLNGNAGNALSVTERNQLVSDLTTSAKTRAQVLRAVAEDPDLNTAEFNRAFVLMQFFGYLRRNPNDPQDTDYTGYDFWLGKLNQFNGNFQNAEMVKAFIVSGEYKGRFGP
jgi:hypothetical protein